MDITTSLIFTLNTGLGSGVLISEYTKDLYARLNKPWFAPPSWLFGVVWPILYVMMAIGIVGNPKWLMILYAIQLSLNFWWSIVFFKYERIKYALLIIIPLLVLNVIITIYVKSIMSKVFFGLYTGWLFFATLLNLSVNLP